MPVRAWQAEEILLKMLIKSFFFFFPFLFATQNTSGGKKAQFLTKLTLQKAEWVLYNVLFMWPDKSSLLIKGTWQSVWSLPDWSGRGLNPIDHWKDLKMSDICFQIPTWWSWRRDGKKIGPNCIKIGDWKLAAPCSKPFVALIAAIKQSVKQKLWRDLLVFCFW